MSVEPAAMDAAGDAQSLQLKRVLGPWQLIFLGIGGIIGAGIFSITGTVAAQYAGPAVLISFVIAAVGCMFAGLCYAEFAAMIPVSGSAYTYAYASFGRFIAWVIGWDLVLEYGVAAGAVSVSWSAYFASFMKSIGLPLPEALSSAPLTFSPEGAFIFTGAIVNMPAVAIIVFLSALLIVGMRASAGTNAAMVLLKVGIIVVVILFGLPLIKMANLVPFVPENQGHFGEFGWSGVLRASGAIFFSYIGFDSVSVAAQETINPQRNLPIGILGSLAISTVLYLLMALTMTGLVSYTALNVANPVTVAIGADPQLAWLQPWVDLAAIIGTSTVILVSVYGQTRVAYSMSCDGLLPPVFSKIHPCFATPARGTLLTMLLGAALGGLFPIDILGELVSIGTLAAFVLVCIGLLVLRWTKPNVARPFRTPWVPFVPLAGIFVCGAMMIWLPQGTLIRLGVWFFIGLVIYALYGSRQNVKPAFTLDDAPQTKTT